MCNVHIYTDGACSGNPGVGGYGAILIYNEHEKIIRGYHPDTTNNQMELAAVIAAIRALKKPCDITVYTDSNYVCDGWASLGKWLAKKKLPNRELWQILNRETFAGNHNLKFQKVTGHSGDVMNERCDHIAKEQIRKYRELMREANENG